MSLGGGGSVPSWLPTCLFQMFLFFLSPSGWGACTASGEKGRVPARASGGVKIQGDEIMPVARDAAKPSPSTPGQRAELRDPRRLLAPSEGSGWGGASCLF